MKVKIDIPHRYNNPTNDDTCVVMCFFNPAGYKQNVKNTNHVVSQMRESNIPLFLTELVYDDETPQIKDSNFIVRSNSRIFSKENLWNITENKLPDKYKKIIFLDSDIKFSNKDWFNQSSNILDDYPVIQPMSYVYRKIQLNSIDHTIDTDCVDHRTLFQKSAANFIFKHKDINQRYCYAGYSIGFQRSVFKQINGFFELSIIGGGDSLFWYSFLDLYSTDYIFKKNNPIYIKYCEYKEKFNKHLDIKKIFYVKNSLSLHLYHGQLSKRNYVKRGEIFDKISNKIIFFYNKDEILEIDNKELQDLIVKYFYDRKEDN